MKLAWIRIVGLVLLGLVLLVASGISYLQHALPAVPPAPTLAAPRDSASVARGRYLAHHVAVCIDCHSTRDWSRFSGPPAEGSHGAGGDRFDQTMGFPGVFVAQNITPHALAGWTDGEIFRVITTGVGRDGEPMFPVMPYPYYGQMDSTDVLAIIAYLRTLQPIATAPPRSQADLPFNLILRTIPQPAQLRPRPDPVDTVAYGGYLALVAGCIECHSPAEQGRIRAERAFAGGREFPLPAGVLRSSNISPHATGLGAWTREQFVSRFAAYRRPVNAVGPDDFNTVMPWTMYAGMSDADLAAIYAYLRTVAPQDQVVTRFSPRAQ